MDKANHAWLTLLEINEISEEEFAGKWPSFLERSVKIMQKLADNVFTSREKDYLNPFRKMLYENSREMEAVVGKLEENDFVKLMQIGRASCRERVCQYV